VRRRILIVALSSAVLAVVLLGVPLGFAIQRNAVTQARGELERAALQAAVVVSPTYRSGDPVELPSGGADRELGLYEVSGVLVTGTGPTTLEPALRGALAGSVVESDTADGYATAVPVSANEQVIGIVRASSPQSTVRDTVIHDLAALCGLALITLLGAGLFAYFQARRLGGLVLGLADAATELGAGNFAVRPPVSGVPEIDRTGEALAATAIRLEETFARERAFATHASHQLRTPLTLLRLELEAGLEGGPEALPGSARAALASADDLSRTIDDVLALSRQPHDPVTPFEVEPVVADLVAQWSGAFADEDRPVRLVLDDPPPAATSEVALRQILQVLLDNAWRHGAGPVTVTARASGEALAVDVADRGGTDVAWPDPADGRLGLALARSLAESQRGRLLLDSDASSTRFTLLVPAAEKLDRSSTD